MNFFNELFQFNIPFDEFQTNEEYVLVGDLAGVSKDNLSINYNNGMVRISGSRDCQKYINMFSERWCGSFTREFTFPSATTDNIKAQLKDGVLEVRIPKKNIKHQQQSGTPIKID